MNVALSTYHQDDFACFKAPGGLLVRVEDSRIPEGYEVLGYEGARRLLGQPDRITDNPIYNRAIVRAVGVSLLVKGGDHTWIGSDSAINYFRQTAAECHDLYRKHLPLPEWSHRIGVADIMFNNDDLGHIDPEVRMFGGLIHDDREYFRDVGRRDMTSYRIVADRWLGNTRHIPYLVHFSDKMTDPVHLKGVERIFGQVRTAMEENADAGGGSERSFSLYGFYANGRDGDKTSIYALDLWGFLNGLINFPNQQKAESYLVKMRMKGDMLRLLPIDQKHKDAFSGLERQIEEEVFKLYPDIKANPSIHQQFGWAKELIEKGALRSPEDPDGHRWTAWLADRMRHMLN